ncbi:Plasmid stabilization system [Mesorhizobium sp. SOD10]|nr:Plasmid stabilization system [Mesorhizobium sp. SOD10]
MLRIVRTSHAEEDLIAIWQYVARDSEAAADRLLDRIENRWQQLAIYPSSGPLREDIAPGVRHLVVGEYLTFYRIDDNAIESCACCTVGANRADDLI